MQGGQEAILGAWRGPDVVAGAWGRWEVVHGMQGGQEAVPGAWGGQEVVHGIQEFPKCRCLVWDFTQNPILSVTSKTARYLI